MGYRVEYGREKTKSEQWGMRRILFTLLFLGVLAGTLKLSWPEGAKLARQLVLPEQVVAVWQGTDELAKNLGEGIPLRFALKEFYHGVTEGIH